MYEDIPFSEECIGFIPIVEAIEQNTGFSIEVKEEIFEENHISGDFDLVGDRVIVRVNENLNLCRKRFVVAKELAHAAMTVIYIKARASDVGGVVELMEDLAERRGGGRHDIDLDSAKVSEYSALLTAIEFLFPVTARRHWLPKVVQGEVEPIDIALRFRIPENIVILCIQLDAI